MAHLPFVDEFSLMFSICASSLRPILGPAGKELEDARVVQFRVARGILVDGQRLPLHARVEDLEDIIKGVVIADLALRSPFGQGQMGQDKCGKLWGAKLHRNGSKIRLGRRVALFT